MAARVLTLFRHHTLLLAAIVVTIAVYARSLFFGHISWDDPEMVFRNGDVHSFNLKAFFSYHYVGNYLPVTMMLHAVSWLLFGANDTGHHLLSLLLHLANGILVYRLSGRMFRERAFAVVAAVLFLLHPLQVESVAWISELKNILFTGFFLSALISYHRYIANSSRRDYIASLVLFTVSCLCKPAAVAFPLVMICVDLSAAEKVMSRWKEKIPFLLIALLFGLINLYTQSEDQFINYSHAFPALQRVGYAGYALARYISLFFLPSSLSVIYPYPEATAVTFVTGYLVIVALLAACWLMARRERTILLPALLFFVFNLVLVLQLIPFGEALYADRYSYLAIVGLAWLVSAAVIRLGISYRYAAAALMVLMGVLTYARAGKWKTALTLYEDIIRKHPDNFVALNSAGVESMIRGNDREALAYFEQAVKVAPRNYKGHYNMGLLYLKTQEADKAIGKFNDAIALFEYSKAYTGRATAYYLRGDLSKAIHDAEHALTLVKDNPKAYFVLGSCYSDMNKLDEAIGFFDIAIRLDPMEADYYFKRGIVRGKNQRFTDCIDDLQKALSLRPSLYEAHFWLGVARVNLKQDPCDDFRIAARNNYEPAVRAFNKMCR